MGEIGLLLGVLGGVLAALWLAGWRLGGFVSPWSDLHAYFLPKYAYAADRIAAGALPLWNPLEFCGIPFLATIQIGVFYPPVRLAYAFLSGEAAYDALFLFHVALGGIGGFWLARECGVRSWPAILAGMWVAQPTWLIRIYEQPSFLASVTWVPFLVLLARRLVMTPSARIAALAALVAALQLAGGYPPVVLATSYLLALGLPFWILEARGSGQSPATCRRMAAVGVAVPLAAVLAAAQILPTLELVATSYRQEVARAYQAAAVLTSDLAALFGLPLPTFRDSLAAFWHAYGPGPLVLGGASLLFGWRRAFVWYAATAVVLCALLPAWVYRLLPLQEFVRGGHEWHAIAPLVVYLSTAAGLDALLRTLRAPGVVSAVASLVLLGGLTVWNWRAVEPEWTVPRSFDPSQVPAMFDRHCPTVHAKYRSYWMEGLRPGSLLDARVPAINGYEQALLPGRSAALNAALRLGNPVLASTWPGSLIRNRAITARAALRCVAGPPRRALERAGFVHVGKAGGSSVWVDPTSLPRARVARQAVRAGSAREALDLIREGRGADVVLEGAVAASFPACADSPRKRDWVRIVHDEPERVAIEVAISCPGYLVLADTWYPGWTATVDGRPTEIRVADGAFRAVPVPAGRHLVRFDYTPRSVAVGLLASAIGVVATLVLLWLPAAVDPLRAPDSGPRAAYSSARPMRRSRRASSRFGNEK